MHTPGGYKTIARSLWNGGLVEVVRAPTMELTIAIDAATVALSAGYSLKNLGWRLADARGGGGPARDGSGGSQPTGVGSAG